MINKIPSKGPSCDVDNCLDVASIKPPDHGFDWEIFGSSARYKQTIAFNLKLLLPQAYVRGTSIEITDPIDLKAVDM